MARPTDAPTRSMNRLARRTDRRTAITYNETQKLRSRGSQSGMMARSVPIKLSMLGRVQHRDIVLRAVAAACKLVRQDPGQPLDAGWNDFRMEVVTAVSEAFNNIVLHAYAGRDDGIIEMNIRTGRNHISVELRDFGDSFDPSKVPEPDLDGLPESGLGMFIIKELMDVEYRPGRPNVLVLSKRLDGHPHRPHPGGAHAGESSGGDA
jgi:anti-sigma regulatory factor (Ser/Thr protein kinase)